MQKALILLCLASVCFAQISIPLTRQSLSLKGSEYEEDALYVFDLEINHNDNKQTLKSVVDIQSNYNFVVDSQCSNCFTSKDTAADAFVCGHTCSKPESPQNGSQHFLDEKIKAVQIITLNTEASLANYDISLTSVSDITQLKDNYKNPIDRLYLDQAKAGLGFGTKVVSSSKSSLSQIFEKLQQNTQVEKQFSLFFNSEMGRLLIGKSENFFQKGDLKKFKVIEDEEGELNWGIIVGPYFTVKGAENISTVDSIHPDATSTNNLNYVYFSSITKYLEFPLVIFQRLHRQIFSYNGCTTDQSGNNICDCPSSTTSYVPIGLTLVVDPRKESIVNNSAAFQIEPESYLEKINGGKSNGKCLLLIKPSESKETSDFTFGTSFLSNYYTIYNFERKEIHLAHSHGFVPAALAIDNNYRIPFIIVGTILALLLVLLILCLLKGTKVGEEPPQDLYKPHQTTTVSYLVRSPREIESIQQITKSVKSTAPIGTPIHARVINSAYSVGYSQQQIYGQY